MPTIKQQVKIVAMGPWMEKNERGEPQIKEEGKPLLEWLSGKSIDELDLWANVTEFEKLLRQEIEAQRQYRDRVTTELCLLRAWLLDQANAIVSDLSKPGATVVEAYNNGIIMGRHWRPVEISQKISDILDKLSMEQVADGK